MYVVHVYVGFPGGASDEEPACQCRRCKRLTFSPWFGKIPWRRKCNPLQYSCLENPMDRGAWRATVHRVPKSQTRLSNLAWIHTYACVYMCVNPHMAVCIYVSVYMHVKKEQFWSLDCQVRVFCLAYISFKEHISTIIFTLVDHSKNLNFLPLLMKT